MTTTTTPGAAAYELPQEFRDFQSTIRDLVAGEIAPRAAEIDRTGEYPWDVRKALAEHDILGLPFPEELGGTGTGTLMLNVAVEEIAKACASSALILMVQELGTLPIQLHGTRSRSSGGCPPVRQARSRPPSACPSPRLGRTPARCARRRCATATSG